MKISVTLLFLMFASLAVADVSIVATIDAPDTSITGLGYGNGSLWAVNSGDEIAYQLEPGTGNVLNSWALTQPGAKKVSGCTFVNNTLYVCAGNLPNLTVSYCYKYTTSGTCSGSFSLDC